jgi:hypothetical protein
MRLFWHAAELEERDWLRYLLAPVVTEEYDDFDFARLGETGIHAISTNVTLLRELDTQARRLTPSGSRVLVHLSDEWFSGGYAAYRHFDAVIRTHATHLAAGPGILTIPLGYPNRTAPVSDTPFASERPHAWSFVGEVKASRHEMASAMRTVASGVLIDTVGPSARITKAEFNALLSSSSFSPCPMGNVMAETWRLYESLEQGCVPLVERRSTLDYYTKLLGDSHPIPTFRSWSAAAHFCRRLLKRPGEMDALQREISTWWESEKRATGARVCEFVQAPTHARALRRFARRPLNRTAILYEPARMIELARHQSARSLARALLRPRAIVARVGRDSGRSSAER